MIKLTSLLTENIEKYTIYLDMDGVLTDFDLQVFRLLGMYPYAYESTHGKKVFWDRIDDSGVDFWKDMEWTAYGMLLWNELKPYNPTILSSPSRHRNSKLGKIEWINDNLGDVKYILSSNKWKYSGKNHILIDDNLEKNIRPWIDHGGIGIHHTSVKSTLDELSKLGFRFKQTDFPFPLNT